MHNPFQLGKRRPVNKMERKLSMEERRLLSEITDSGWKEYRLNMMYKFIREMNSASRYIVSDNPNISDEYREQCQKKYDQNKKELDNQINKLKNHYPSAWYVPKPQVIEIELSKLTKEDVFPLH